MPYKLWAPGTRKGNRKWIARGSVDGQQFEKVLEAETRPAAKKEADKFEAKLRGPSPDALISFEQAARAYIDFRRPRKDDLVWIERLIRFIKKPAAEIVGADLISAANALLPKAGSAHKNRSVITNASAILHYAQEQGWCAERYFRRFPVSRKSPRRPVASETMQLLLANTEGVQQAFLAFLYEAGPRITDLLRLDPEQDLDLRAGTARLGSTKTDDSGVIGLSPELVAMLANVLALPRRRRDRLFPWGDRHNAYRWLKPLCERLNVSYTPHQSRHAMATDLRALGMDRKDIAQRGIWRDERSVDRYDHHRSTAVPERGVVLLMGDRRGKTKPTG